MNIPVLRWGKPYQSLEVEQVVHFVTGEPVATVSQANGGLLQRDMRKAKQAREALRDISCEELIERLDLPNRKAKTVAAAENKSSAKPSR